VAAVGPLLLVVAWSAWALGVPPVEPSEAIAAMDARIGRPEVVVLGNSGTRLALDEEALASALHREVAVLAVDGFASGGWYALLRHRVVERGLRPRVVVVASVPGFALRVGSPEPLAAQRLAEHVGADDVVLAERLGLGSGPAERWRRNRVALRGHVLAGVRTLVGWAWLGPVPADEARRSVDRALLVALGPLGVVDPAAPGGPAPALAAASSPEVGWSGSMMPEIAAEVAALGAHLVVVVLPRRSGDAGAEVAALRAGLLGQPGTTLVDLSDAPIPDDGWLDDAHLGPTGRAALLPLVARAIHEAAP
jgi:hypothetical protein